MSAEVVATHARCEYHPRTSSTGRIYQSPQSDTIDGLEFDVFNVCHDEERIRNLIKILKTAMETTDSYDQTFGAASRYSNL